MTNFNITLGDAIDLNTINTVKQLCENMNPSPLNIYCSVTGACIGEFEDHAIWQVIQSMPSMKAEDIAEEIRLNCMLSMRPSPAWVSQTPEKLKNLVKLDPVGACVYFLTRAYHQNNKPALARDSNCVDGVNWRKWDSKHAQSEFNWERVQLANWLRGTKAKQCVDLALLLCEIDSIQGLHTIRTPSSFLDTLLQDENFEGLVKHYTTLRDKLIEKLRKAKIDRSRANSLSRQAFNYLRPEKDGPSKKQVKQLEAAKKASEFNEIFNQLTGLASREEAANARKSGNLLAPKNFVPSTPKLAGKAIRPGTVIKIKSLLKG